MADLQPVYREIRRVEDTIGGIVEVLGFESYIEWGDSTYKNEDGEFNKTIEDRLEAIEDRLDAIEDRLEEITQQLKEINEW